jgi:hypothetical protein
VGNAKEMKEAEAGFDQRGNERREIRVADGSGMPRSTSIQIERNAIGGSIWSVYNKGKVR